MSKDNFCKSQLITCNRVKECNGVCPFEDALKHADQTAEEQNKIDHDREWIIGCIKHDGFIHTHRFDKANQIILDALEPSGDLISRADAIETIMSEPMNEPKYPIWFADKLKELPSAEAEEYDDYEHATLVDIKEPLKVDVVRCKDCKHWHSNTEFCGIWSFQNIAQRTLSDDYCSRGERREP